MAADLTTPGATGKVAESTEKDIRTKKKITNDTVKLNNFEQQLLARNMEKAAGYFVANRDLFNYRTFRQIDGDGTQIINKLRGVDNLEAFYRIKPAVLSLLRPKIRLFKVTHEEFIESQDGRPDQGTTIALRQPCYKEFKFSDNFGVETAVNAHEYLKYESTKPNWRNVGLKSFSFTYLGRHGPLQTDLVCTLVLTFKSLKDLGAQPPGEPPPEKGGLRYSDLVAWPGGHHADGSSGAPTFPFQIKALVGYTQPTKAQLKGLNLSSSEIETIANIEKLNSVLSLGLNDYEFKIEENGKVVLTLKYQSSMEILLASAAANIFQKTFRVATAGRVHISKKIKAEHNITNVRRLITDLISIQAELIKPSCKDEKCGSRRRLKQLIDSDKMLATILKEGFARAGKLIPETGLYLDKDKLKIRGLGLDMFSFFKDNENIKKLIALTKRKVGLYEKDIYKGFVDQLIVGNDEDPDSPGTRLFCMSAGTNEILKATGIVLELSDNDPSPRAEQSAIEADAAEQSTTTALPKGDGGTRIDRCHLVDPINPAVRNEVAQEITSAMEEESSSKDGASSKTHRDPGRVSVRDFSEENYKFYFVYLGDIIELACKNAGISKMDLESIPGMRNEGFSVFTEESYFPEADNNTAVGYPFKNTRILLGPMEYRDPAGRIKKINLAQFPVSFNFFRAWFLDKVIRPRKMNMPLGDFIRLLVNDLVLPGLSAEMSENFRAPNSQINVISLTLPGKQVKSGGADYRACGRTLGKFKEALPMKQVIDTNSAEFKEGYLASISGISQESLVKTSFDYLLIQTTTASKDLTERKADPTRDAKDGIYHFNIGSDMGLLKKMNFTKVVDKDIRDFLIVQSLMRKDPSHQLRMPFHTDLFLVGNPLFIPGMYYYVNPSLTGLGNPDDPTSMANRMFLGGYHTVNTVETTITNLSYETVIKGKQLGIFGVK